MVNCNNFDGGKYHFLFYDYRCSHVISVAEAMNIAMRKLLSNWKGSVAIGSSVLIARLQQLFPDLMGLIF